MSTLDQVVLAFGRLGQGRPRITDDDLFDRFNHLVMAGFFVTLSGFCSIKQLVGNPINCWPPAEYTDSRQFKYVNNVCWVSRMYFTPMDEPIPMNRGERYIHTPTHYRWALVFFLFQALMFKLPHVIWGLARSSTGSNLDKIINMTLDTSIADVDERDEKLASVAEFIHNWTKTRGEPLRRPRDRQIFQRLKNSKNAGYRLLLLYLFIKVLYVTNSVGQMFLVSYFLSTDFYAFGISALNSYAVDGQWEDELHFPRVAYCDLYFRQQNNVNHFTVQCVIALNLFLEKMFLFSWFALLLAQIASVGSLVSWIFWVISDNVSLNFMKHFARLLSSGFYMEVHNEKLLKHVVRRYLLPDGVFILRLVAHNTDDIVTAALVRQIMLRYRRAVKGDDNNVRGDGGGGDSGNGSGTGGGRDNGGDDESFARRKLTDSDDHLRRIGDTRGIISLSNT